MSDRVANDSPRLNPIPEISNNAIRLNFAGLHITANPGTGGFSVVWRNHSFDLILPHLVIILNVRLSLRYFPATWRSAIVIVLKKTNKESYDSASTFRPISILNALSKLNERLIHSWLRRLADTNEWFSESQHEFGLKRSTESPH